jgi:hypothetical protein
MAEFAYESWVGSDTIISGQASGSSWDICALGSTFLPGVVTIENLEVGRDIDVQKRKKKEKARIKDNGLSPVTFDIIIELTGRQWSEWLKILPTIQPKEGVPRKAFSITHPMVNAYNVQTVYIHKIKCPAPCARKGMRIEIHCGEWIDEVVDVPNKGKVPPVDPGGSRDAFGNPNDIVAGINKRQGLLDPSALDNVMSKTFDAPEPTPLPGRPGWHGFRHGNIAGAPKVTPRKPDYSIIPTAL